MSRYFPLILGGVLLNAAAQLVLKAAMRQVGRFDFTLVNLVPVGRIVATHPLVLTGLACYAVSVAIWLLVLSRVEVSYAYPLLSLGYIVTALAGWLLFDEAMTPIRWIGTVTICAGVWLITRSG